MEHLVPQHLFSTPNHPAKGISAVKALAIANAQGQKIWTIKKDNLSTALAATNLPDQVNTDIRNAVNAGKVVTTQTQPVTYAGGQFTGYIVIDPATGSGAYLLGNGANGGHVTVNNIFDKIQNFFWAIIDQVGGKFGGIAASANDLIGFIKNIIGIINNCPTGLAVIGIISFTFFAVGFALLTPLIAFLATISIVFSVVLVFLSSLALKLFGEKWIAACRRASV